MARPARPGRTFLVVRPQRGSHANLRQVEPAVGHQAGLCTARAHPGRGAVPVADLRRALVEPDHVRPAVPRRAAARHLQLHARGRQQRPGREGDQPPEPLHRHARPGERRLHRVQVDAVRHRGHGAAHGPRRRLRQVLQPRRRADAVRLLRRLLALVLRLQALPLRPRPSAHRGGEGAVVHAADVRPGAARELRGLLVPDGRDLRDPRHRALPARGAGARVPQLPQGRGVARRPADLPWRLPC